MATTSPGRSAAPSDPDPGRPPDTDRRLPLATGGRPALRADAARNRERLLEAAVTLFRERGVEDVSVDEVVAAAGVGKGTLYRIFGDKSGLGAALLDERERELQQGILSGPPPLGPGATAVDRVRAFVDAYVRYVVDHVDLVRMSQTARQGARFDTGAHRFWRTHLAYLAGQAGATDPWIVADVLLAAMTAEQIGFWIRQDHRPANELAQGLGDLATMLLQAPGTAGSDPPRS